MTNSLVIEIRGLTKEFRRKDEVVCRVDMDIKKGGLFCLVGPNGAGKTTLIKMLCGLILPTSGEIIINGYDMAKEANKVKVSIGLVTGDERSFYWRLTGRQNMEFFAALYGLSLQAGKKRIRELFGILHIDEPNKRFQEYASGVKQKLSIARALLSDPSILFIDELTKSLDPTSAMELRMLIKETLVKKQGKTVFFSSHNLHEVEELADRIALMSEGRILAKGTLEELRKATGNQGVTIEDVYTYFIGKKAYI